MEVPPSIEGQQIVSVFSTLPSHSSNPLLLKDDSSLLPFSGCWLATCRYDLYDPVHHTNEGPCREAQGAFADGCFSVKDLKRAVKGRIGN